MTTPLPSRHSRYAAHGLLRAAYLLLLTAATAAFVYPLVSASLKAKSQVFDNRPIPRDVQWSNFVEAWNAGPVLRWLSNSAAVGVMAATTVTLSSARLNRADAPQGGIGVQASCSSAATRRSATRAARSASRWRERSTADG